MDTDSTSSKTTFSEEEMKQHYKSRCLKKGSNSVKKKATEITRKKRTHKQKQWPLQ